MWTLSDLGLDQPRPPYERMRVIESLAMSLSPMHPRQYDVLKGAWDEAQREVMEGLENSVAATPDDCAHQWKREERAHPYVPERREDRMACQKCGEPLFPWRMIRLTRKVTL